MKRIKTWNERCEEHPDHQERIISQRMIQERIQEEIDELRQALEDGWCDWICPKPQGYLMQCCDCELIHEVDFRVVQYEPRPSEVYEVVDDPNLQAQMRLRRRDDLSPKREWVGLTDEELEEMHNEIKVRLMGTYRTEDIYRSIEAKLKEKNHG